MMQLKTRVVLLLLFQLIFGINKNYGQSSVVTCGTDAVGTDGTVSYSVGQIDYMNFGEEGYFFNEGVQQPFEFFELDLITNEPSLFQVLLYPNPTHDKFTIKVSDVSRNDLSYQLFDVSGKQLKKGELVGEETDVDISGMADATYLLLLYLDNRILKSIKIIKNHY